MEGILINNAGPYEGKLDVDTDLIEVSSLNSGSEKLDEKWSEIDVNGHFHAYSTFDKDTPLPTLELEVKETKYWCEGCSDEHVDIDASYHCIICKVLVEPKKRFKSEPAVRYMPGRLTATLALYVYLPLHREFPVTFQSDPYFGIARLYDYKTDGDNTYTILRCDVLAQRPFNDL